MVFHGKSIGKKAALKRKKHHFLDENCELGVIPYFQTLFQLFGIRKNSTFVEIDALWNY